MSYRSRGDQRYAFYLNHGNCAGHGGAGAARTGVADAWTAVGEDAEIPGFGVFVVKENYRSGSVWRPARAGPIGILSITGGDLSGFRGELAVETRLAKNLTGLYPEILRRYPN